MAGGTDNQTSDDERRFRGVTELVLDAKGRLAIPARHREQLADGTGHVVLTADPSHCLLIYPIAVWEPIQRHLMSFPSFNERLRSLQRLIVGHADDVEIDAAGLDKQVVLVGQGHRFELWDEGQWQAQTAQTIAFPAGLPPELGDFSL